MILGVGLFIVPIINAQEIYDRLDGKTLGHGYGITYSDSEFEKGAVFNRELESRIEYLFSEGFPQEGTVEIFLYVTGGYNYDNYKLSEGLDKADIFNTGSSDVWYPGAMWLSVTNSGKIVLSTALNSNPSSHDLIAENTHFRFNEWHAVSFSYGDQGQFLMVDGKVVASELKFKEKMHSSGDHNSRRGNPTLGEYNSCFWKNNQYDSGFEGKVSVFRASDKQQDWTLFNAASPPLLSISDIQFIDENGNNRIDGKEDCYISFLIENKGKGPARNLNMQTKNKSSVTGVKFKNMMEIGYLAPQSDSSIVVPVSGTIELTNGHLILEFSFTEQLGFPPDPIEVNVETKEFIKPVLKIVDHTFLSDNGLVKLGVPIQLKILVQNLGQGVADSVMVNFIWPVKNVFPSGPYEFNLGKMIPGDTRTVLFEFVTNKLYDHKSIPISVNIIEKYGYYGEKQDLIAEIDSKTAGSIINIASHAQDKTINIDVASLSSDIDKNIPYNERKYPNRYALIIGNEDYTSRQKSLDTESNVPYALNDAKVFKEYCTSTFGVEEENTFLLLNATAGEISQKIELLTQILNRIGENGELIFYYSGHGYPDEVSKIPYLIPVDVSASNLTSAIKLSEIFTKFSTTQAGKVLIFLDACFTGGGRNAGLLSARAVKVKPKMDALPGNLFVFSATSEDQSALQYEEKQHGIFTYFLLKRIQESQGEITLGGLEIAVCDDVSIESLKINQKPQDPQVNVGFMIENTWRSWQLK